RSYIFNKGRYVSVEKKAEKDEKGVYELYYDFSEPINKMVSHRVLATNRGEKEGVLKVGLEADEAKIFDYLNRQLIKDTQSTAVPFIVEAYKDAYKRFIGPVIEREIRNELTESAENQAISVFGENLRHLLLQSPLKGIIVLGYVPAYLTDCKLAVIVVNGNYMIE